VILSQDVHQVFGGVVPELASRAHLRALDPVVGQALDQAGVPLSAVDAIAVTQGPGLVGALLVGVCYAKALAAGLGIPLVGVHHLEGHLFAPTLEDPDLEPPFVALIVSGGHTLVLDVPAWGRYRILGETRDDAAGEAFDKVAALLELGYPGGPVIERLAAQGSDRFKFPRPMLRDGFDFSFSGLKTAVLHVVKGAAGQRGSGAGEAAVSSAPSAPPAPWKSDVARSFQDAVIDVLVAKTARAVELTGHPIAVLGGGVACNQTLVTRTAERLRGLARVAVARPRFNLDNAAMIARAGWYRWKRGETADSWMDADPSLPWPGLETRPIRQPAP
jgi:N6-L-threonylcarbamoyladenine synthase